MVRHQKGEDTYWLLPGGGVQFGETLEEALVRELREEACVDIKVGNLAFVTDAISREGERHLVQVSFQAEIVDGDVLLGTDERVVEVKFLGIAEIETLNIHPPMNTELIEGMRNGFGDKQKYLGNRWLAS
jgi:8-oxo-dGTP diphosphatase